jgi:hypothetical protein
MKRIILIALSLSLLASIDANAYKITREYSTSTPGIKSGFIHLADTNSLAPSAVGVRATAPNQSGVVSGYSKVLGNHDVTIVNRTKTLQGYRYIFSVDCAGANFSHTKELVLSPNETYRSSDQSFTTVQAFSPGSLRIIAATRVTGESSDSTTGSGTLTVRR